MAPRGGSFRRAVADGVIRVELVNHRGAPDRGPRFEIAGDDGFTGIAWHDGSDPERMHNYYAHLYNRTVFDLLRRRRGEGRPSSSPAPPPPASPLPPPA